jgi:hypothetical protein
MRKLFTLFYLAATVVIVRAEDKAQVSGVIEGKLLRFAPEVQRKLAENSIKLLASCSYSSLHDGNTNKVHFEDAEKRSHLTIIFSKPHMVEVQLEKINVKVKEMVITLPLTSGGIWVRSDGRTSYFAMFTPDTYFKLEALLKEAQRQ